MMLFSLMTLLNLPITYAYNDTPVIRIIIFNIMLSLLLAVILPYPIVVTVTNIQQMRLPYSCVQGLPSRFSVQYQLAVSSGLTLLNSLYMHAIQCIKKTTVMTSITTSFSHVLLINQLFNSLTIGSCENLFIRFLNLIILNSLIILYILSIFNAPKLMGKPSLTVINSINVMGSELTASNKNQLLN